MESSSTPDWLSFGDLQFRLVQTLRRKLDNGEFTERGLARLTGISQPQVHNLLKGARRLNQESADTLLAAVNLSVVDLLTESDLASRETAPVCAATLGHRPNPSFLPLQLPLQFEPEPIPRKNPASTQPRLFALTERAS